MSNLTLEKLEEMMRKFPAPPPDPFSLSGLMRPGLLGMRMIVEPEIPVLQLSRECAELVGPAFTASVNAWLIARFGFREPLAKQPLILSGHTLIVNRRDYGILNAALT